MLRCTFCTATLLTGLKTGGRPGRLCSAESNYPSIDMPPDSAKNRPECLLLKTDSPGPGNIFSGSERTLGFFNDLITSRKGDMIVSKCWRFRQGARIITETSLVDREAIGPMAPCAVPDVEGTYLRSTNAKNSALPFYATIVTSMRKRARRSNSILIVVSPIACTTGSGS